MVGHDLCGAEGVVGEVSILDGLSQESCGVVVHNDCTPVSFFMNCKADGNRVVVEFRRRQELVAERILLCGELMPDNLLHKWTNNRLDIVVWWGARIEVNDRDGGMSEVFSHAKENSPVYGQYSQHKYTEEGNCSRSTFEHQSPEFGQRTCP